MDSSLEELDSYNRVIFDIVAGLYFKSKLDSDLAMSATQLYSAAQVQPPFQLCML